MRTLALNRRGVTIPELLVTISLFTILMAALFFLFHKGLRAVRTANAQQQAQISLNKAHFWLERDLQQADPQHLQHKRVASPAGNGDAVWFLSPEDPRQTDPDLRYGYGGENGAPVFQTQILYYLIRPVNYQEVSGGLPAAVDPDPNSDFYAPHKFLIRKVIDTPADPETLLSPSAIDDFITPPLDYTLSPFAGESSVIDYRLVSDKLLSFEVLADQRVVQVRTSALKIEEARRRISIGNRSLKDDPLTVFRETVYVLRN